MKVFGSAVQGIQNALQSQALRAHNVANVNTTGFKSKNLIQSENSQPTIRKSDISVSLTATENPLDVTVVGKGYFQVERPDGSLAYTRNLQIQKGREGNLTDNHGYALTEKGSVPSDRQVHISEDGTLFTSSPQGESQEIGKLLVYDFKNPSALHQNADHTLSPTQESGEPWLAHDVYKVASGFQENSNTDLAVEQVGMMTDSALVKANISSIKTQDEMLGDLLDLKG